VEIAELGQQHRAALRGFSCAGGSSQVWSRDAEFMVHALPSELEHPDSTTAGIGAFGADGELVGLAAWSSDPARPDIWTCRLLAVRTGMRQRGFGALLKRDVLRRARTTNAATLVSFVHRDNEPMLRLNTSLGATMRADPILPEYLICTIRIR